MIRIRSVTDSDMDGHYYEIAQLPLGLRYHDAHPKKNRNRCLMVRAIVTTVFFAKDDVKGDTVVAVNTQTSGEDFANQGIHTLGRKGGAELVLDAVAPYIVTRKAYIACNFLRVEVNDEPWDILAYYFCDNNRDDMDEYSSIEAAFDHDDRYWQACTLGGCVIPQYVSVTRPESLSSPIPFDLEKLPLLDGKRMSEHLCMFDNIPEAPPEEEKRPTGILNPQTGRPFTA